MKRVIMPLAFFCVFFLAPLSCRGQEPPGNMPPARVDSCWLPLIDRLAADGMDRERMMQLFSDMALPWSPVYMAAKVQERYGSRLGPGVDVKPLPAGEALRPFGYLPPAAGGFEGAKAMLGERAPLLAEVRRLYGVPPELVAAILLLESDMGHELGDGLALHALASMAATATPEQALRGLEGYRPLQPPLRQEMEKNIRKAAASAYKELRALIHYCETGGIDILRVPGSIYGAIGLCQFMPANIGPYGVDSGKKGVVDLFDLPDAAHSIGNFLKEHGFAEQLSVRKRLEAVRRYNHSDEYAAFALGMSYQLAGKKVPAELRVFGGGRARKPWWPKKPPTYRLPALGRYAIQTP